MATPMEDDSIFNNDSQSNMTISSQENDENGMSMCSSNTSSASVIALTKTQNRARNNAFLKAQIKGSLYDKILTSCGDIGSLVSELLCQYIEDKQSAIISIIQLLIDVCGYQHIRGVNIYSYATNNFKDVVHRVENDFTQDGKKFIFMGNVKLAELFSDFLQRLVVRSFALKILFDGDFSARIVAFIKEVASSRSKCLRSAGVILAAKLLTTCLELFQFVNEKNEESLEDPTELILIDSFIQCFYTIYDKNMLIPDRDLNFMKIMAIREIPKWIDILPEVFIIKRRCLSHIKALLIDADKNVRLAALEAMEVLILEPRYFAYLRAKLIDLVDVMAGRVIDVDLKVATEAIKLVSIINDKTSAFLNVTHKRNVYILAFNRDKRLSKPAADFLIADLKSVRLPVLVALAKITTLDEKFGALLGNFVESCGNFCKDLTNWAKFVEILLNEKYDLNNVKKPLLKIMATSVSLNIPKGDDLRSSKLLFEALFPHIKSLLTRFLVGDRASSCKLFEIIAAIHFGNLGDEHLDQCEDLLAIIKNYFIASSDVLLLEKICLVLQHLKDQSQVSQCGAEEIVDYFEATYLKNLDADLKLALKDPSDQVLKRIKLHSLKLSVLMEFANIDTKSCYNLMLMFLEKEDLLRSGVYIVTCCKWNLIWDLRQYIKSSLEGAEDEFTDELLIGRFAKFVNICLIIMAKLPVASVVSMRTFNTFCDFYRKIGEALHHKTKQFERFVVKITKPDIFVKFLIRNIILDTTLALNLRREYLCNALVPFYHSVLPGSCFAEILFYYETFYEEFGAIMDSMMGELTRFNPALSLVIMHTLAKYYTVLSTRHGAFDILSESVVPLKKLAQKLAQAPVVQKTILHKLLDMAILFAFKDKKNYQFLAIAQIFVAKIPKSEREDIYQTFKKALPKDARTEDAVLLFADALKNVKNNKRSAQN